MNIKGISVIMPTYNQGAFISRAIASLICQTFTNWELIIINDGATDYTEDIVNGYLDDKRIKYFRNKYNEGLGACLNKGIDLASNNLIAYLPSDDIYFSQHLESLFNKLIENEGAALVYSGVIYKYRDNGFSSTAQQSEDKLEEYPLQLVQVLHKKTQDKWMERDELVTDDLDSMFWIKLLSGGKPVPTMQITCEWVSHPEQRHKLTSESHGGGIYAYKNYYNVKIEHIYNIKINNLKNYYNTKLII